MHSFALIALLAWAQGNAMTLAEVETEATANNSEIRSLAQQARVAESRLGSAAAFEDPQLGYRAWSKPIFQPWNRNQTQHMFMFAQNLPAKGKRALKYLIASEVTYAKLGEHLIMFERDADHAIGGSLPAERKPL